MNHYKRLGKRSKARRDWRLEFLDFDIIGISKKFMGA